MAIKIVKILIGTVALGALISAGAEVAQAQRGLHGGGHGTFGGARVGGFSGAHGGFGGAHVGGFSGAHIGGFGGAHISRFGGAHLRRSGGIQFRGLTTRGRRFSSGGHFGLSRHVGRSRNFGRNSNFAHGRNFGRYTGSIAHNGISQFHRGGRNHWGNPYWKAGWNGGWGGWYGPVFWPYVYGDLLSFVFWPYDYYYPFWFDPFWGYGGVFVWDAIFWPGPYYDYAYEPPFYDVYGDYAYYGGDARWHGETVHYGNREVTDSVPNSADLRRSCGDLAPGVTDLPIKRIEATLHLTDDQLKALDALKVASSQASDVLKASCSSEISMTPVGRLDAVQKRVDSMVQAFGLVRTPFENFYNSLNEKQRRKFAALGPASSTRTNRRGSASGNNLAALCSRRTEGFTQLPMQRIEQAIKPTQQQQEAFDKLKFASADAATQLQASCPTETPQTQIDRFDAVAKRLDAMAAAIKTIRPALVSFYDSLTDEQKARFNILSPPKATSSRQG